MDSCSLSIFLPLPGQIRMSLSGLPGCLDLLEVSDVVFSSRKDLNHFYLLSSQSIPYQAYMIPKKTERLP
jgi:hypothetical protein